MDSVFGSYGSHLVPNNQYGRGLSSNCKSSLLQPFLAPPVYPTYSSQFQPSNGQLEIWFFGFLASPIPTSRPAGAESVCDSGMEPASSAQPPPGKMPKNSVSFAKTPNDPNETSVVSLGSCSSAPLSRKDFSSAHYSRKGVCPEINEVNRYDYPHELEYDYPLMCTKVISSGCFMLFLSPSFPYPKIGHPQIPRFLV